MMEAGYAVLLLDSEKAEVSWSHKLFHSANTSNNAGDIHICISQQRFGAW